MSKLNLLWVGLAGMGLAQGSPALAESAPATATSSVLISSAAKPLSDSHPRERLRLAQTHFTNPSGIESPDSALLSLSHLAEHYRCGTPATALQPLRNQLTNRYEIAALLASCLESLGDRPLNGQEQSALKTLRSEFSLELATLQGSQVDSIRLRQSAASNSGPQPLIIPSIRLGRNLASNSPNYSPDETEQKRLGIDAEARFGNVGVFGRYSVAVNTASESPTAYGEEQPLGLAMHVPLNKQDLPSWSTGIGIRGFIVSKSLLTLSAGNIVNNAPGQPNSVNYGAFYQFPVGDRLTLSPSVAIITNPTKPNNPDIQGAIQASFSF
jgi:hypothetical protein